MNKRTGLKRLALAVGVPYFGWWALAAYFANNAHPRYIAESAKAGKSGDWQSSLMWMKMANDADHAVMRSATWGLLYPALALIIAAIGYWVYRGFKPKP